MDIEIRYNKVFLQKLRNDVTVRERALPILRAKESALRLEVKLKKKELDERLKEFENKKKEAQKSLYLWGEFPELLCIKEAKTAKVNIAGVFLTRLEKIEFQMQELSIFTAPKWFLQGVNTLKELVTAEIQYKITRENLNLLSYASKKTTQKVNLYEKVQIPLYLSAIMRIKRFLEDEENLSRAAQKIIKQRRRA